MKIFAYMRAVSVSRSRVSSALSSAIVLRATVKLFTLICGSKSLESSSRVTIFDSYCYFILIYNLCTFLQAISWMQKINNTAFGNSEI